MRKKIFIISIVTFLIDMLTKYFIKDLVIIKNFFEFKRVINDGAAWSIFSSKRLMLILIGVCAIYFIIKFISDFKENKRNTLAFGLLLGGCLGNLLKGEEDGSRSIKRRKNR